MNEASHESLTAGIIRNINSAKFTYENGFEWNPTHAQATILWIRTRRSTTRWRNTRRSVDTNKYLLLRPFDVQHVWKVLEPSPSFERMSRYRWRWWWSQCFRMQEEENLLLSMVEVEEDIVHTVVDCRCWLLMDHSLACFHWSRNHQGWCRTRNMEEVQSPLDWICWFGYDENWTENIGIEIF